MEYADLGSGASVYTGWFINGVRHGEGRCFFHKTGEECEGEWACDEPTDLKLFQHDGPLLEGPSGDEEELSVSAREEGGDILKNIEAPPKKHAVNRRSLRSSTISSELNSSLVSAVSAASTAAGSAITDLDDQWSSKKSLSASFTYSEQGLKTYLYENGDVFKGHLEKATKLRQGSGVYTEHRMGSAYNGDWRDSKRHGVGHLKLASGVEYSGEFFEDKIHGQGSLTLIDGSVYTGSFFNGLFHGRGMLEDEGRNRVYFGEFENGERSGEGEEKFSDGSRYVGVYKDGKRNGTGVLFDSDGSELYRGEWHEDRKHGKGELFRHQQEGTSWEGSYDGDFFQDKFSGNGSYKYTDGTSIEGQWLDNVPRDGDWSIKYPDGSKFYGFATFQHPEEPKSSVVSNDLSVSDRAHDFLRVPLPHGFGSLTYPSGQRFVGSFSYGEYDDGNAKK